MPRVVFFFRGERAELLKRIAAGKSPREFLYGMDAFREGGWEVDFAEAAPGDSTWERPVLGPFERAASRMLATGFSLSNAVVHWDKVRAADVVVSTTDGNTMPLLALKKAGMLRGAVIGISQGLYESRRKLDRQMTGAIRLPLLGSLLAEAFCFVVLGIGDQKAVRDHFGAFRLPRVEIVQFGADADFWTPGGGETVGPVLSVGSDHLRDYDTLLRASRGLPLRIVTRRRLPTELLDAQTVVNGEVDDLALRELYRRSRFVVIPVKNEPRDSGHSATLQAMACGKAVVLSDTQGLWDRQLLRDGENCLLVPPENPTALRAAMDRLSNDPAEAERIGRRARRLVEEHWNSRQFGAELVRLAAGALTA